MGNIGGGGGWVRTESGAIQTSEPFGRFGTWMVWLALNTTLPPPFAALTERLNGRTISLQAVRVIMPLIVNGKQEYAIGESIST